jgi:hypothetical protein
MKYYVATIGGDHGIRYSDECGFSPDNLDSWVYDGGGQSYFASTDYEVTKTAYLKALQKMLDTVGWAITTLPSKESLQT